MQITHYHDDNKIVYSLTQRIVLDVDKLHELLLHYMSPTDIYNVFGMTVRVYNARFSMSDFYEPPPPDYIESQLIDECGRKIAKELHDGTQ